MGNDFELNGQKIPFMWKTQLDSELIQSYIEQSSCPGAAQYNEAKPTHTSVKETGTSCICQISPERWRDSIDLISKSTSVPPECMETCHHDYMRQGIYDNNATPHAVSHSNSPQNNVWSGQSLVSYPLHYQAPDQEMRTLTQGDGPFRITLPDNTCQYFAEPSRIASPRCSHLCNDEPFQYRPDPRADASGSRDVALTTPHETYHQTNFVAQNSAFRNDDISQSMRYMAISGSWWGDGNALESNDTPLVETHDQGGT